MENGFFERQIAMAKSDMKAENQELIERLLVNGVIGGTKMGYGIQFINAGFGFHETPIGGQEFMKRIAEGATTFIPGTGIGIIDALQSKVRGEMQIFRQSGLGISADAILNKRLADLDKMDEQRKAMRF